MDEYKSLVVVDTADKDATVKEMKQSLYFDALETMDQVETFTGGELNG